jgi:hypothetical protein
MTPHLAPAESTGDDQIAVDRLRALGVDVQQLARKPLPAGSWALIAGIVSPIRGKSRRWYAAASLYGRFLSVLNSGGSLEQLIEQYGDARALARLMAHSEIRELILSAGLPGALNRWLAVVIRRTKLRRREKVEVATTLVSQFHERLSAGRTAAEIIQSLGDPPLASRRFRREMLRRRSWFWRLYRAAWRTILLLIAALLAGEAWLLSFDPFLQWCWNRGQDQEGWEFQLVGPCLVPLVAGREEILQKADELDDLYAADLQGPGSPDEGPGAYTAELDRLRESRLSQIRYLPLLLLENRQWTTTTLEGRWKKATERDALAIVVAVERFHRRRGDWPQSTEALAPEFLKSLPIDPYDGKPLRLAIMAGNPAVYSVGLDRIDNTAQHADDDTRGIDPRDWQLFAPKSPEQGEIR